MSQILSALESILFIQTVEAIRTSRELVDAYQFVWQSACACIEAFAKRLQLQLQLQLQQRISKTQTKARVERGCERAPARASAYALATAVFKVYW
jgi:hypothetical protein